jgi:hypothetical protein
MTIKTQSGRLHKLNQRIVRSEYSETILSKNQLLRQKNSIQKLSNLMAALFVVGVDEDSFDPFIMELVDLTYVSKSLKRMNLLLGHIYVEEKKFAFEEKFFETSFMDGDSIETATDYSGGKGKLFFDMMVKDLADVWDSRNKIIEERIWKAVGE